MDLTSIHTRRAIDGDAESLEWLVARLTPLLIAQARYRMGRVLLARIDPEDVVQEAWAIALKRLPDIEPRGGHYARVLVKFLATTLLHHVNNLIRTRAIGVAGDRGDARTDGPAAIQALPEETRGPITRAVGRERYRLVIAALEELGDRDREVIVLRAVEQHSNAEVAEMMDLQPNTTAQVYRRALQRLRDRLPGSVFDELSAA